MGGWSLLSAMPIALLIGGVAVVLVLQGGKLVGGGKPPAPAQDHRRRRAYGQVGFYLFFAALFVLDFFLILRRDGFRASWSLTFWMVLAAFMVGEAVGRWNSHRAAGDEGEPSEP